MMAKKRLKVLLSLVILIGFNIFKVGLCMESEKKENKSISEISAPVGETGDSSDLPQLLRILKTGKHATAKEASISPSPSTSLSTTTTEKPSPFFRTERPVVYFSGMLDDLNTQLDSIISSLLQLELEEIGKSKEDSTVLKRRKRGIYHILEAKHFLYYLLKVVKPTKFITLLRLKKYLILLKIKLLKQLKLLATFAKLFKIVETLKDTAWYIHSFLPDLRFSKYHGWNHHHEPHEIHHHHTSPTNHHANYWDHHDIMDWGWHEYNPNP